MQKFDKSDFRSIVFGSPEALDANQTLVDLLKKVAEEQACQVSFHHLLTHASLPLLSQVDQFPRSIQ